MKRTICILLSAFLSIGMRAGDDLRLTKVVIDPGHGGNDPGAISPDRKSQEKAFTLDISTRLASLIKQSYPDVNVHLTRTTDTYVTLDGRADIANKSGAQLFISIHINAAKSTQANGFSVHVLGQSSNKNRDLFASNMDVCKRENSVVMLEDDYSTKYEGFDPSDPESYIFMTLMQNANLEQSMNFAQSVESSLQNGPVHTDRGVWQNPFLVLWRTSMPAVLVELGFISNSNDLAVLRDNANRDKIARCLYEAFKDYKTSYETSLGLVEIVPEPLPEPLPEPVVIPIEQEQEQVPEATSIFYGVQIMAATTRVPDNSKEFMGYTPTVVKGPKFYKYIIGVSEDISTVKNNYETIRKRHPQSYIVQIEGDKLTRISK